MQRKKFERAEKIKNGVGLVKKKLKWGDVVGGESFFKNCSSTLSVSVKSGTRVEYIEKSEFESLVNDCPEFYQKFYEFCAANENHMTD